MIGHVDMSLKNKMGKKKELKEITAGSFYCGHVVTHSLKYCTTVYVHGVMTYKETTANSHAVTLIETHRKPALQDKEIITSNLKEYLRGKMCSLIQRRNGPGSRMGSPAFEISLCH